jgi:hypothetical protein
MLHKSSEKTDMSEISWASERLQEDIAPRGSVKERIRDAAHALKWKYSRTRTIWYADERASIKPKELRRITEVTGIEYGQQEVREISALISQADALLEGVHEDFHRPFVAALRAFAGALDRSRTRGGE